MHLLIPPIQPFSSILNSSAFLQDTLYCWLKYDSSFLKISYFEWIIKMKSFETYFNYILQYLLRESDQTGLLENVRKAGSPWPILTRKTRREISIIFSSDIIGREMWQQPLIITLKSLSCRGCASGLIFGLASNIFNNIHGGCYYLSGVLDCRFELQKVI